MTTTFVLPEHLLPEALKHLPALEVLAHLPAH